MNLAAAIKILTTFRKVLVVLLDLRSRAMNNEKIFVKTFSGHSSVLGLMPALKITSVVLRAAV